MNDVTQILSQIEGGDAHAADRLLPLVYEELRRLAATKLAHERPGQTLQATALVHDAFIRLVDMSQVQQWNSRGHFFAAAAIAMRRILVENARKKKRLKHGANHGRVDLDLALTLVPTGQRDDLLALDEALNDLAAVEPEKAAVVQLRYFAGLSWQEIADCQGMSLATVKRHWLVARAWLYARVSNDDSSSSQLPAH
ncbi:MAG: sigma-70 family RNA polymerase sigma factor [Planctomycetales bacterium]|nr:sigma-70 family RNA polymerase sigma factor [Planctomycetales bacterium]